jgi:hypothetical protein
VFQKSEVSTQWTTEQFESTVVTFQLVNVKDEVARPAKLRLPIEDTLLFARYRQLGTVSNHQ